MPKFTFQLEGLLRHRNQIERQRQRELAVLLAQFHLLQRELQTLDHGVRQATSDLRQNQLVGRLDMSYLAAHRRFVAATQRRALGLAQKMTLAQRQIDEARNALTEAAMQRKIIEKLRDKQHQRWLAESNRREALELDEIATQLARRWQDAETTPLETGDGA